MTTEKQIQANRKNASKSTGAKTKEGKSKVSQNAIKHGILSIKPILPWEPENEFEKFSLEFKNSLKPQGGIESFLVERLITIGWRIKRIAVAEAGFITVKRYHAEKTLINSKMDALERVGMIEPLFGEKEARESFDYVMLSKEAERLEKKMQDDFLATGNTFQSSMEFFGNMQRYESHLYKQFFMTLYQLEKIQNQRKAIPAVTVEN
jgi:hypothetical protein